jgi:hypothetical protein
MKTISRSATKKIAALKTKLTACRVYSLSNGFVGREVNPNFAWNALARFDFARLRDDGDGTYTVDVHGNLWYKLSDGTG